MTTVLIIINYFIIYVDIVYLYTLNYSSYITQQQLQSVLKKINQSIYKNKHTNKIIYKKNILVVL